jgi:hypothetical protein
MNISILFLVVIAGLLLLFGVVALTSISLVAKKGRPRPDNKLTLDENAPDPWLEAGKRTDAENDEPL